MVRAMQVSRYRAFSGLPPRRLHPPATMTVPAAAAVPTPVRAPAPVPVPAPAPAAAPPVVAARGGTTTAARRGRVDGAAASRGARRDAATTSARSRGGVGLVGATAAVAAAATRGARRGTATARGRGARVGGASAAAAAARGRASAAAAATRGTGSGRGGASAAVAAGRRFPHARAFSEEREDEMVEFDVVSFSDDEEVAQGEEMMRAMIRREVEEALGATNSRRTPASTSSSTALLGECTICLESDIVEPAICGQCKNVVGCYTCVARWMRATPRPHCPLCRERWTESADQAISARILL